MKAKQFEYVYEFRPVDASGYTIRGGVIRFAYDDSGFESLRQYIEDNKATLGEYNVYQVCTNDGRKREQKIASGYRFYSCWFAGW